MITFYLKNAEAVSGMAPQQQEDGSWIQKINIYVGVTGVPETGYYALMTAPIGGIDYSFAGSMSADDAKAGIATFAAAWVATNFPAIEN